MDNIVNLIKLGAIVLITLAVIFIMIGLFGQGQDLTKNTEGDLNSLSQAMSMSKFKPYDGTTVRGSNVVSCIRTYAETGMITVTVVTNAGNTSSYSSTAHYSVTVPTSAAYINPQGSFTSTLSTNANGAVTSITFDQQ